MKPFIYASSQKNFIMGQKIHPLGFRLGITQKHSSQWFARRRNYSQFLLEDHFLRRYIFTSFPDAGIISIGVNRKIHSIRIEISSARPRVLLGAAGSGLESLRQELVKELKKYRYTNKYRNNVRALGVTPTMVTEGEDRGNESISARISIHLTKLNNPNSSAAFLGDFIVEQLEKRIPFRRVLKQAVQRAQRVPVKGIKVQVSGRLNGAEIARSEWVRKGQVPLHTLRAKMEYDSRTAKTIYGLLGIKVWIFQGDQ